MDTLKNQDLVNLVIHGANGQQQMIKIVRNPNGQPLTQESVKAIVKEYMSNSHNQQQQQQQQDSFQHKYIQHNGASSVITSDAASTGHSVVVSNVGAQPASSSSVGGAASTSQAAYNSGGAMQHSNAAPSPSTSSATPAQQQQQLQQQLQQQQQHGTRSTGATASGSGGQVVTVKGQQMVRGKPVKVYTTIPTPPVVPKKTRRRKTDRVGKGLRHFSMKVCEKVREKGTTSYNEVADELVEEFCRMEQSGGPPPRQSQQQAAAAQPGAADAASYDQKNIRRRVYDALNVLMAMNIISKDKKEIRWIGLPTNSAQQCNALEQENAERKERIEQKQAQLRELILQQVSFKSLVTRNKESEERGIVPSPSSAIQMPFIIVNTHKKTHVNCSISSDKSEYQFQFDDSFAIHDDIEVLKRMGLLLGLDTGDCTYEDIERAKTMVPKQFEKYIEIYGRGQDENVAYVTAVDSASFNEDSIIMKSEQMTDEEEMLDDDHYSDMSDLE